VRPVRRRHFSAEVCLVGVPHVNRQSRHAVRTTPTRGHGARLSQRKKSLKSQRPLEDLGTHPDRVQAAAAQLARGECQVGGQGVDVDRVPGHQRLHGFAHERIHADRTSKPMQEVDLQEPECPLGRPGPGHHLHEAVHRTTPQLRQARALVHQVVEHRQKGRRGPWLEPHTHDRGVRRNDLDLRTGQRTNQLGMAPIGKWISTPPVGRCRCTYTASPVRWIQTVRTTPANPGSGGRST
jgi:hypothetical protein